MTTRLSVNINKIALIRNSRGADLPDLAQAARDCEAFGAEGITVHPRPDERHVRFSDIPILKAVVRTEFNVEGNPKPQFMELCLKNKPHQATLVPDAESALTSDAGWDTLANRSFLEEQIGALRRSGIRTSVFIDPDPAMAEGAARCGADRVEFYTGGYAKNFIKNPENAIAPFVEAARAARAAGLGINAGHDLNLQNLRYFHERIEGLLEVSIGHAIVCDALFYGLQNTIRMYLRQLRSAAAGGVFP